MLETQDVRDALDHLSTVEFETSDNAGGIRVSVAEEEIGQFYAAARRNGLLGSATSKRFDDSLVSHIRAEKSNTLGELFG